MNSDYSENSAEKDRAHPMFVSAAQRRAKQSSAVGLGVVLLKNGVANAVVSHPDLARAETVVWIQSVGNRRARLA